MTEIATIIITGIVLILSILWFYNSRETVLHPFAFIAVICLLVQVIGPLDWIIKGQRDYRGIPIMDYIIPAEIIFLIGYLAFWITYVRSNPAHKEPFGVVYRYDGTTAIDVDTKAVCLLYIACFVLYVFYIRLKGRSLLSQLTLGQRGTYGEDISAESSVMFLGISINMLITISCLLLFTAQSKMKYVLYVLTFLLTISSGRRHLMLDIALCPAIVYYVKKRKHPNIVVLTALTILSFLLVGWIGAMRDVYRYGEGTLTAYDSESAWDAIMINLEVFMPLCMYIPNLTTISNYSLGSSYITAILQLIPGIVFPHKQQVISFFNWGNYRIVLGERFLSEGIAGTYWSLLYANGWIVGVIIGMALLGRWVKKIEIKPQFDILSYTVEFGILTAFMFQFLTRSFGNAVQDLLGLLLPLIILRRVGFSTPEGLENESLYIR